MAIGCLSTAGPPGSSFLAASAANTGDVATPDDARIEDTPLCMGIHGGEPSATSTQWHPSRDGSILLSVHLWEPEQDLPSLRALLEAQE